MTSIQTFDKDPFETILTNAYNAFNHRDIDTVLSMMDPEVNWPNGMEGGIERGQDAVRNYWTRQWAVINPHVEPVSFEKLEDGRIDVTVRQIVKDLSGNLIIDEMIHHLYTITDGLIISMEIRKS